MVNYQNSKIYKLVNNIDNEIYVGSTVNPLYKRKGDHKSRAKTQPNRNIYIHLNQVGWENVEIILIENYVCNSKDELHKRERYWIDTLKPSLNKVIPTRKQKEYNQTNKQQIAQQRKEFYQENKQQIVEKKKEYRQKNKEVILQHKKEFYNKNKEVIAQQRKIKFTCVCGSTLRKSDNSQHKKSEKHLFWEKQYNYIYS